MSDRIIQLVSGKKVSTWTIEKKLGEGVFGAVYKCSDDKNDYFALKVYHS